MAAEKSMICPVCETEGQRIVCTAGSKTEIIVYHPEKKIRNVCHIAEGKEAGNLGLE